MLENDKFVLDYLAKAEIFNDYFVLQCTSLDTGSEIPRDVPLCAPLLSTFDISDEKILRIIRSLNPNKAHGWDQISIRMIKLCDISLVTPLKLIFEACRMQGTFPESWKRANVVLIYKKGEKNLKTNYRPISLLPIFGKMLEKLMFDALYHHLISNNLLNPNQSEFRPGDSTINQLLSIVHAIFAAFDCNPPLDVRSVYLDMSKAFDRVWHEGLIFKLHRYGISGELLLLIKSFLGNRKQRTVLNGKTSKWGDVKTGVPQGSILGPLLFLVYINDVTDNLICNVKLFADDVSLYTVVHNPNKAAADINHDLDITKSWANNWRMSFNPDPSKQAVEVTFSRKRIPDDHPLIFFNDTPVMKVTQHKHLGLILDSKLSFSAHIQAAICKSRKGIGILHILSKYLDYGDIIYHIPHKICDYSQHVTLNNRMDRLESVQYSAALALTGAWRGTSREKLYEELGWESLNLRRWSRRLVLFYKILNTLTPDYTKIPIPPIHELSYSLRKKNIVGQIRARTASYEASFYPHCLSEWNKLDPEIRLSSSVSSFKNKLLSLIRPPAKPVFSVHDPKGLAILTQLRVGLSALNLHKFRHNFKDTIHSMCLINDGIEDTEHFLLSCHLYDVQRHDLLGTVSEILLSEGLSNLSNEALLKVLLYGDGRLSTYSNSQIIKATLKYIHASQRF